MSCGPRALKGCALAAQVKSHTQEFLGENENWLAFLDLFDLDAGGI